MRRYINMKIRTIMKNIRLFVSTLCLFSLAGLGSFRAMADDVDAPGKVKLKIETKTFTKDEAASLVSSGGSVTLGVYLVLDANWQTVLNQNKVQITSSRLSFALFEDQNYTIGGYLQNPTDYISICADNSQYPTPSGGCDNPSTADPLNWYTGVTWFNPGAFGWPTYAYGAGFLSGMAIFPTMPYFTTVDGNFEIKLFDLQFKLKSASRSIPVGIIDNLDHVDGSPGNTELNITDPQLNAYRPHGIIATDWTDSRLGSNFEFINGGIFFENGPEVRTFEPSFLS